MRVLLCITYGFEQQSGETGLAAVVFGVVMIAQDLAQLLAISAWGFGTEFLDSRVALFENPVAPLFQIAEFSHVMRMCIVDRLYRVDDRFRIDVAQQFTNELEMPFECTAFVADAMRKFDSLLQLLVQRYAAQLLAVESAQAFTQILQGFTVAL